MSGGGAKIISAEDTAEQQRAAFLTALNNAEVATDYISELASDEITRRLGRKLNQGEQENLESCVKELSSLSARFKQLVESGLNELNNSALKPEVKAWDPNEFLNFFLTNDFVKFLLNIKFIRDLRLIIN